MIPMARNQNGSLLFLVETTKKCQRSNSNSVLKTAAKSTVVPNNVIHYTRICQIHELRTLVTQIFQAYSTFAVIKGCSHFFTRRHDFVSLEVAPGATASQLHHWVRAIERKQT